jgi:hypothetical protein
MPLLKVFGRLGFGDWVDDVRVGWIGLLIYYAVPIVCGRFLLFMLSFTFVEGYEWVLNI